MFVALPEKFILENYLGVKTQSAFTKLVAVSFTREKWDWYFLASMLDSQACPEHLL